MATFLEFLLSFLAARLIWDAIRHYSRKAGELPLVWAVKTGLLIAALCGLLGAFGFAILYVIAGTR